MKKTNPPYYDFFPEYTSFRELVTDISGKYANRVAYSYRVNPNDPEPVNVTFDDFLADVRAVGANAIDKGLVGEKVAVVGKLSYPWVCLYFAMLSVGAVLVPLDPDWSGDELVATIEKAGCAVVFHDKAVAEKLSGLSESVLKLVMSGEGEGTFENFRLEGCLDDSAFDSANPNPEKLALLVFTSGTTGKGKGVMLSARAVLENIYGAFKVLWVKSRTTIGTLPPHHTYGSTIAVLSTFMLGSKLYISSGMRYLVREMQEQKPDHLVLVPLYLETFYKKIISAAEKAGKADALRKSVKVANRMRKVGIDLRRTLFSSSVLASFGGRLKTIVSGGAPLSKELVDAFDSLGIQIINGYGITECSPLISANRPNFSIPGSVGVPLPNEEILINSSGDDGEGEICVKGPNVMMGYFEDPEATAQAIDENGFFHTGDIGTLKNGVLYITGRTKNIIILSNGKNVYPEEIETALALIPGINEIVVYEGERKSDGERCIVSEIYPDQSYMADHAIDDVPAYFSKHISEYNRTAVPYKKIGFVKIRTEEFPKNTMRKILRANIDKKF